MMGAEQVRKRILECPGVGPGGSFNTSFSYKKLFPLAHRWLDEEIKRKGKGTRTLGEHSTMERKLYAAFGKDESLLKKNLLILFQLVDWIVSQVRGFTSWVRSLVQVQDSPAALGKIVGRKSKNFFMYAPLGLDMRDIAQLVELCSYNWVVAITGWMPDRLGGNDSIFYPNWWLTFSQ
jgi:hypothetical protein